MLKKLNKTKLIKQQVFVYFSVIIMLVITLLNLQKYLDEKEVLGASTEEISLIKPSSNDVLFWRDFLAKNPNYIPGWIELGRIDKVMEIDPNYKLGTSN